MRIIFDGFFEKRNFFQFFFGEYSNVVPTHFEISRVQAATNAES